MIQEGLDLGDDAEKEMDDILNASNNQQMNNHHNIVYVPNESGQFFVKTILSGTKVSCLKDVFVFTKEQLDKRDKELLEGKQKIKLEGNFKKPCEGCSTDCYNWQIGDCRS